MHPSALPAPVPSSPDRAANDTAIRTARLDHDAALAAVCELLQECVFQGCHELHIDEELSHWRIRRRTINSLSEQRVEPHSALAAAIAELRTAILEIDAHTPDQPSCWQIGDGRQAIHVLAWHLQGVSPLHLRIELSHSPIAPVLDTLGFSAQELRTLRTWLACPLGWVIIAGATPVGSRQLHGALAQELNVPDRKLLNVASVHTAIQPREIRLALSDVDTTARLGAALRAQRPDILLLEQGPGAGLAAPLIDQILHHGLLVQTTQAANRADLLRQLAACGQSDAFMSAYLTGLLVHQPVRRLCEHCKAASTPGKGEREWLSRHRTPAKDNVMAWLNEGELHHYLGGEGCDRCGHSGYAGQHDLYELIEADEIIAGQGSRGSARHRLLDRALDLARRGEIPLSEVIRLCP